MNERYSRQILFKPIGTMGQANLIKKHVLILGAGALGTSNAEILVRAGVGKLTIIDRDYVEWSNLQRQQLYTEDDARLQLPKVVAAKRRLREVNSNVDIEALVMDATAQSLPPLLSGVDLILDSTDNFDIRMILNDLANQFGIPWIYGSCVGSAGMSYTIWPGETPCFHCLLEKVPLQGATCDTAGIISPAVQMVTVHQTTEAFKILVEDKKALRKGFMTFDLWNNQYYTMNVEKAKKIDCPSCGENPSYPYLKVENQTKTTVLCGREAVQIRTNQQDINLVELEKKLRSVGETKRNDYLLSLQYQTYRLVFFKDGRTLIHGIKDIEKAKSLYYQLIG
ncbi:thiazole biosynthesis adenylyltransferase ThiF [Bacillus sp. 2205SS5-2]|uniref:thiazole biosynthesis adenylyltransferase ThiF n=1 Tax=Bacillus sp. 2205SS5-2 TaxID=3109031 RepID=UPI003005C6D6